MIDLPTDMNKANLIQWLIDNPDEYTVYTYNYTSTNNRATYTQYYFILNAGYESHIATQEFTDVSSYVMYFVNKSGVKDKNYLTIIPTGSDGYATTLGSNYKDVRVVMCFSPTAGQVFTITDGKLTSYTGTVTGLNIAPELIDFTLDDKQYSYTGYSVYSLKTGSYNKYKIRDVHDYTATYSGLQSQVLGSVQAILVSDNNIAIGKYIKVPLNTAKKLLAGDRNTKNTVYGIADTYRSIRETNIVTTYKSNNTMYARLDISPDYLFSGYRKELIDKFKLYELHNGSVNFGSYLGTGTEPGIDIKDFISITTEDMNTAITNSGAQKFRELVSELSVNVIREGYSMLTISEYWAREMLNIIAHAIPDLMNILPKMSQVNAHNQYEGKPILNATVHNSADNSTVTYNDILNSYISSDDFGFDITFNNGVSFGYNPYVHGYTMLTILTVLGFFRPNSTKSTIITKG